MKPCRINGKIFEWILISRRSCFRAGVRYYVRGKQNKKLNWKYHWSSVLTAWCRLSLGLGNMTCPLLLSLVWNHFNGILCRKSCRNFVWCCCNCLARSHDFGKHGGRELNRGKYREQWEATKRLSFADNEDQTEKTPPCAASPVWLYRIDNRLLSGWWWLR